MDASPTASDEPGAVYPSGSSRRVAVWGLRILAASLLVGWFLEIGPFLLAAAGVTLLRAALRGNGVRRLMDWALASAVFGVVVELVVAASNVRDVPPAWLFAMQVATSTTLTLLLASALSRWFARDDEVVAHWWQRMRWMTWWWMAAPCALFAAAQALTPWLDVMADGQLGGIPLLVVVAVVLGAVLFLAAYVHLLLCIRRSIGALRRTDVSAG